MYAHLNYEILSWITMGNHMTFHKILHKEQHNYEPPLGYECMMPSGMTNDKFD